VEEDGGAEQRSADAEVTEARGVSLALVQPSEACADPLRARAEHRLCSSADWPRNAEFSKSSWARKLRVGATASI
jgi:hypothetical protein